MDDKILGCLVGCGLGDALGAPFELRGSMDLKDYNGILQYRSKFTNRFTKEEKYNEIGQVTDDTEMTLILARHIAEYKTINRSSLILSYIEWAKNSHNMGRNTRFLFKNIKTVKGVDKRREKLESNNESNGALMRCSILALIPIEDALIDCRITNPNNTCLLANEIYLTVARMIISGNNKIDIREYLERYKNPDSKIHIAIKQALNGEVRDVRGKTKGWCVHGLYCALYSLFNFENFKDAIDSVIKLGGDTDTNGAICGALLGWYYGFERLIAEENENIQILLNCHPSNRDLKYTFNDIFGLVHSLC